MSDASPLLDCRDLEPLRTQPPADPAARGRVRSRLVGTFAIHETEPGRTGGEGPAKTGVLLKTSISGLYVSLARSAIPLVVGGAVGAALHAGLAKPQAPVVYIDRPVARPAAFPIPDPPSSGTVPPESPIPAASAVHASAARSRTTQLSAERHVLEEARTAIIKGDTQYGLDLLERHRRLFRNPLLGEERDALRVRALVKAGRYDDARTSADSFRERVPDSIFIPMVQASIASIR